MRANRYTGYLRVTWGRLDGCYALKRRYVNLHQPYLFSHRHTHTLILVIANTKAPKTGYTGVYSFIAQPPHLTRGHQLISRKCQL